MFTSNRQQVLAHLDCMLGPFPVWQALWLIWSFLPPSEAGAAVSSQILQWGYCVGRSKVASHI